MVNRAEITGNHYAGSGAITVAVDEPLGTLIVVVKTVNGVETEIGTGTIGNDPDLGAGNAIVILTGEIELGNTVTAFVNEVGNQGGKTLDVYEFQIGIETGWQKAKTVGIDGEEFDLPTYLALGGQPIAKTYAPDTVINDSVERENQPPKDFIDFTLIITYGTGLVGGVEVNTATVKLGDFNPAIGNPSESWDGWAKEQTHQKVFTFADNGTHTVDVYPEGFDFQKKSVSFEIDVADTEPEPVVTDIWAYAYEINPVSNRSVGLLAYCLKPLECRILIVGDEEFVAMSANTGYKWNQAPLSLNVPNGTYVGQIRKVGTTAVQNVVVKVIF